MWSSATYGTTLESKSDKQIVAEGMAVLQIMYGKSIPQPAAYKITRWHSDPFSYGSYSVSPLGSTEPQNRNDMAETVKGNLFFAGEATSALYPCHSPWCLSIRPRLRQEGDASPLVTVSS